MKIHGYTGNKYDIEHCFVRDSAQRKRRLFFTGYTDVNFNSESQVGFYLYTFKKGIPGVIEMMKGKNKDDKGKDFYVKVTGKRFTITINKDKGTRAPHLGPGPYMAIISVSPASAGADEAESKRYWYYPYATWENTRGDCWLLAK
jgi:hypothetical protein